MVAIPPSILSILTIVGRILVPSNRAAFRFVSVQASYKSVSNSPVTPSAPAGPGRTVLAVPDEPARGRKPVLRDELGAVVTIHRTPPERLLRFLVGCFVIGVSTLACGGTGSESDDVKNPDDVIEEEEGFPETDGYEFYRSVSMTMLRTNRPEQASRAIRRLFKLRPDSAEPYYLMGRAYLDMRHYSAAKKMLQKAIVRDSDYGQAYSMLGVALNMLGKHKEADRAHLRAIEIDSSNGGFQNNLGFSYYLQKHYRKAIKRYETALDCDPGSHRVHNNLGFAFGRLGNDRLAYEHFRLAGVPAQASNNMGYVSETKGNLEKAYEYYVVAVKQDPGLIQARRNLERICKRLGRSVPEIKVPNSEGKDEEKESAYSASSKG